MEIPHVDCGRGGGFFCPIIKYLTKTRISFINLRHNITNERSLVFAGHIVAIEPFVYTA